MSLSRVLRLSLPPTWLLPLLPSNEYRWTCERIRFDGLHSHSPALPLIPIYGAADASAFRILLRLFRGMERHVKYNFMDDSKYWSTLETSQMLNPYR